MKPSKEWMEKYEALKDKLAPLSDLNEYFTEKEIAGQAVKAFSIGKIKFPTGEVLVRDPLVYMGADEEPYFEKVPTGEYDVVICAVVNKDDCARYAAVKVDFPVDGKFEEPVKYIEALIGNEELDTYEDGNFFGFNVDAGLASIMDVAARDAYCRFEEEWLSSSEERDNMYDDYFSDLFEESAEKYPEFQRDGGDWVNTVIPGTDLNMPVFQSGFGDGAYPVYFGYDKNGKVCRLVVQFIDIALAYSEK